MYGESVTRVRSSPGGVDQFGDPIPGTTTQVDIPGCAVAPRLSAAEQELTNNGRAGVVIGLTLYTPADADVTFADHFIVRGEEFEVDGDPGLWVSPFTGKQAGKQIALRRVEG